MDRRDLLVSFLMLVLVAFTLGIGSDAWAGEWCDDARKELERKEARFAEYLRALQASYERHDLKVMEAVNHKINQVKREIETLKRETAQCEERGPGHGGEGLSSAKTDEAKFGTKNCAELRKMVFPLLRRTRALKRKEKSLLSSITPEEQAELAEATEQLQVLNRILKTRCGASSSRSSLLKRLRR